MVSESCRINLRVRNQNQYHPIHKLLRKPLNESYGLSTSQIQYPFEENEKSYLTKKKWIKYFQFLLDYLAE